MYRPPATKEDSIAYREALLAMVNGGGFKLFSAYMAGMTHMLLEQLMKTNNPDERAVLAGGLRAVTDIKKWPEIQLAAFAKHLDKTDDTL